MVASSSLFFILHWCRTLFLVLPWLHKVSRSHFPQFHCNSHDHRFLIFIFVAFSTWIHQFLIRFLLWSIARHQEQVQQDIDSIFYVHPSEGPNSLVVSLKLNGCNYLTLSRYMQCAFGEKNKLAFITGKVLIPGLDNLNRSA